MSAWWWSFAKGVVLGLAIIGILSIGLAIIGHSPQPCPCQCP